MRVLLLGAAGQLGTALRRVLAADTAPRWQVATPDHAEFDVTQRAAVDHGVAELHPDVVINTTAFHDVPRCEREGGLAFAVNTLGPRHLAIACARSGARLLHLSTDYVFDGKAGRPYGEEDRSAPLNLYGETKLAGERQALLHNPETWIVRTAGLFGHDPCRAKPGGRNFIEMMLHLAATRDRVQVVDDVRCNPTFVVDLAAQLRLIVEQAAPFGVYHAVNPPPAADPDWGGSWHDFARAIFAGAEVETKLEAVGQEHFSDPVPRPVDSRLDIGKLERLGLSRLRPLDQALSDYLRTRPRAGR